MIDFNNLHNLLQVFLLKQQDIAEKSIILFLGKTGAGKSTAINYLLGYPLKRGEEGQALPADPDLAPPAEIGHTLEAYTMYPALHKEASGLIYCDCPGFEDNRGPEVCVATTLCMQATVNLTHRVLAAVVVIDYISIKAERGRGLKELAATLGQLLKNSDNKLDSLLFVVNRVEEGITKDNILKRITAITEVESARLDKIQHANLNIPSGGTGMIGIDFQKQSKTVQMLQLMQTSPDQFVILDIFDEGQSRNTIFSILKEKQNDSSLLFDFIAIDPQTADFKTLMAQKMEEFIQQVKNKSALQEKIKIAKQQKSENEEIMRQLDRQSLEFASKNLIQKVSDRYVETCKALINNCVAIIAKHKKEIQQINIKREDLKRELFGLDTDEVVFYQEVNSIINDGFFRSTQEFDYRGIPFVRTETEFNQSAGSFEIKINNPQDGLYQACYKSSLFTFNTARVYLYIAKRHKPENANRIQALKEMINTLENQHIQLANEIKEREDKHAATSAELQTYLKKQEMTQLTKLEALTTAKNLHQNVIRDLQTTLHEDQRQIDLFNKTLEMQQTWLNHAKALTGFLQFIFPDLKMLINDFLAHYQTVVTATATKQQSKNAVYQTPSQQAFFRSPSLPTAKTSPNEENRSYSAPPRKKSGDAHYRYK